MAITNLANTKWQFKNEPALSDLGTFAVNFTSNNTDYTSLTVTAERMKYGDDLAYGEPIVYPVKGDLITMDIDGTSRQYRVLNINNTIAEVVVMENVINDYTGSFGNATYAGSAEDTTLNTTYYNTLSAEAKAAIIDKTFRQDSWYDDNSGNPDYSGYYGETKPGTSAYTISLGNANYGEEITRHIYLLSVQDVLDYILDINVDDGQLQNYNIWKMFWNDEVSHEGNDNYIGLRSRRIGGTFGYLFMVYGNLGSFSYFNPSNSKAASRPAFQIDLSKIDYTIST